MWVSSSVQLISTTEYILNSFLTFHFLHLPFSVANFSKVIKKQTVQPFTEYVIKKLYLPKPFSMYRLRMRNCRAPALRFWLRFGQISGGKLHAFVNLATSLLKGL
jgi:hypothetical protein